MCAVKLLVLLNSARLVPDTLTKRDEHIIVGEPVWADC